MKKHQLEINLTALKKIVAEKWNSADKDKFFRSYENKAGEKQDILIADLCMPEPKYVEKADGTKVESDTAVLHNTGFAQVSEKVGEDWKNDNFANLKQWKDKVDTTPPAKEESSDAINPDDIPF